MRAHRERKGEVESRGLMVSRRVNVTVATFVNSAGRRLNAQGRRSTGLRRQNLPLQETVEPVTEGHNDVLALEKVEAGLRDGQNFSAGHEGQIPIIARHKAERVREGRAYAAVGPSSRVGDG